MMHNPPAMVKILYDTEWSSINKLNIVNHFCIVAIIGQIEPWWVVTTRTTHVIKHTEQVLSAWCGQIELRDFGVCSERIWDISKQYINYSLSASCRIPTSGYIGHDSEAKHHDNSKNTPECQSIGFFQGNFNIIFLSVCGYIKLNIFNE